MHLNQGWRVVGCLGLMLLCTASMRSIPGAVAESSPPASSSTAECDAEAGQTLELLARDLVYRSQGYAAAGQFDLAARSLEQALLTVPAIGDPFAKTEMVANIAGESGGQPSTMEQMILHASKSQQKEISLALLPKIAAATQALEGEYGVINTKRAILIRLARYYTTLGQTEQARSLLDEAEQLLGRLQGDGFGLIAAPLAEGYAAAGEKPAAIAVLDRAVQQTEAMKTQDQGYLADIYRAIAIGYGKAGAEQPAQRAAERIQVPVVKAKTLAAIARYLAQAGSPAAAETMLTQAQDILSTLPEGSRSDAMAEVALAYAESGQWESARERVGKISSAEVKIRTLAELASISHRANRPEPATKLMADLAAIAQTISPFDNGDSLLREISGQYLANQQYELALALSQSLDETLRHDLLLKLVEEASAAGKFAIAQQAAEVIPPGWENQTRYISLRSLAAGYAQAGQYEQAIQLLTQIKDNSNYPSQSLGRVAIAQAYREEGQVDRAADQLTQALKALETLENSPAKLEAMGAIAVTFAQMQQSSQAADAQARALAVAKALNPQGSTSYSVEQLLSQSLKAQEYPLAFRLVEALGDSEERDRPLQMILQQMLDAGELSAVSKAAEKLYNPHQKVAFWLKVADHYRGTGQPEPAAEILAQALTIAQNLTGPDENSFVAVAQIDPSIPVNDDFDRGSLLEAIALRYAEMGRYEAARQAAQSLRSPLEQERLIQRLACYQG